MIRRPPIFTLTATLFPYTRSSDLLRCRASGRFLPEWSSHQNPDDRRRQRSSPLRNGNLPRPRRSRRAYRRSNSRSEEHTSELQSLMRISYAVFCLKKKKTNTHTTLLITRKRRTNPHSTQS